MANFTLNEGKVKVHTKYDISRTKKMQKLLEKDINTILHTIGKDMVQKLQMYTARYWYNNYTPADYRRTYTFLNSISYTVDGSGVYLYYDFNELKRLENADNWNSHMGFDGEDFSKGLIEFIETGRFSSGKRGSNNNPRYGKRGSYAIEKTIRWLNKYINDDIRYKLKQETGRNIVIGN